MRDWFTVEALEPDTYVISEYRHWEETHCYLLCGERLALLIDTGLGVSDLRAVTGRLTGLPVLAAVTHVHWDHIGVLGQFSSVAVHAAERDWLAGGFPRPLEVVRRNLTRGHCDFPPGFSAAEYRVFQGEPQRILHDGDRLDLGGRAVTVLHTPGHSPGHCCFYEPERGTLYAGDLLYCGCLDAFYPSTDPVQFWQSVRRVRRLAPRRILPGHHRLDLPPDFADRVEAAFSDLASGGKLRRGSGRFSFGDFQIHL